MITVNLSPQLWPFMNGESSFLLQATTVAQIIPAIRTNQPLLASKIFDTDDKLLPFANMYLNSTQLCHLEDNYKLQDTDNIDILVALVGG